LEREEKEASALKESEQNDKSIIQEQE